MEYSDVIDETAPASQVDLGSGQDIILTNKFDPLIDTSLNIHLLKSPTKATTPTTPQKLERPKSSISKPEHIESDFCVGNLITSDYECRQDNGNCLSKPKIPRAQRRKIQAAKIASTRYRVCEFSCPKDSDSQKNNSDISGSESRLLDIHNKKDREILTRLRRNLDTLKSIAEDKRTSGEHADPYKVYKEIPESVVNLYLVEDITIKPIDLAHVCLKPKFTGQLGDKIWMAHPYKNTKNHIDFQNHKQLSILPTIIDKTVCRCRRLCIRNNSHEPITLQKGTLICQAKELYYSTLPAMHPELVAEIDRYNEVNESAAEKERNESPKAKAQREYADNIKQYANESERAVIDEFKNIFIPNEDYKLDKIQMPPIQLGTKEKIVRSTPPPGRRHFSEKHDEAISTWLEVGLMNGLISRAQSDTVSPLHCVEQNGKLRIVMDSRKVNEQLSLYNYIFPKISEDIEELSSGKFKVFSQTDLTGAFNQIEVHEDSRFLLAFSVYTKKYRGVFAYNRLPFGVRSAPSIFASVLDHALEKINAGANGRFLIKSFIDDIVIGAIDREAMIDALRRLFGRLAYFNFKLSLPKSFFFTDCVAYCGIEIRPEGYCISEKRKKILREYPDFDVRSRKKNADLSHLGFFNWHRRFVQDYSQCDRKIRDTIKSYKDKSIDATEANEIIKQVTDSMKDQILKAMLITPSKDDTVILQCDASGKSWGYVCYCERGVFAYGGGSFSPTVVRSHNIFEKEAKGMSNSLSDVYKLVSQAKDLIIKNDNLSLIKIHKTNKTIVTPRIIKYMQNIAMLAQELPSNFVHLSTHENYLADVLSRLEYHDDGTIRLNSVHAHEVALSIQEAKFLSVHKAPVIDTDEKQSLLDYYRKLHKHFHWSIEKTLKSLPIYGIPVNKDLVQEAWLECPSCQKFKKAAPISKLKFRETPSGPLEELHIDHIIKKNEHRSTFGHEAALTTKCALTRYFTCFPVKDTRTRTTVQTLQNFFMSIGRKPKHIYADNAFDTVTMHDFCDRHKMEIKFRSSSLSRSVSVESTHRRLHEKIASILGSKRASQWHEAVWQAAMALNCQPSDSTGFTPYYLFFGHHPVVLGTADIPTNVEIDQHWQYDLEIAKQNSDEKRRKTSSNYKYPTFQQGQKVIIKIDNSKHAGHYEGEIVTDEGGANALIKLENRAKPIMFHKGFIRAEKYSEAWKTLQKTNRDFQKPTEKTIAEEIQPVSKRTRSKTTPVLASLNALINM